MQSHQSQQEGLNEWAKMTGPKKQSLSCYISMTFNNNDIMTLTT